MTLIFLVDGKSSTGSPPRLSPWTVESSSHLEAIGKELVLTGQNLAQLYKILESIESIPHLADNEVKKSNFIIISCPRLRFFSISFSISTLHSHSAN